MAGYSGALPAFFFDLVVTTFQHLFCIGYRPFFAPTFFPTIFAKNKKPELRHKLIGINSWCGSWAGRAGPGVDLHRKLCI
jgi:hypothetical protein